VRDDFQGFELQILAWAPKLEQHVLTVRKKVAFDILKGVVMMTPVDTGRARGNWQVTVGEQPREGIEEADKTGDRAKARGLAEIELTLPGEVIWIHNNLPYIGALERGHSGQAPHGMLRVTLNSVEGMFR